MYISFFIIKKKLKYNQISFLEHYIDYYDMCLKLPFPFITS